METTSCIGSVVLLAILVAGCGEHQGPGEVTPTALPESAVSQRTERQAEARRGLGTSDGTSTQILFGDLHVPPTR